MAGSLISSLNSPTLSTCNRFDHEPKIYGRITDNYNISIVVS